MLVTFPDPWTSNAFGVCTIIRLTSFVWAAVEEKLDADVVVTGLSIEMFGTSKLPRFSHLMPPVGWARGGSRCSYQRRGAAL